MAAPREIAVSADGLGYAGLEWGNPEGYPILALHGWLDNALSFAALGPLLTDYRVIALDLSGQGLSDHRSPDATYHIWDDVPQLLSIVTQLDLPELAILGHSRGAAISVLLAATLGPRCSHLVLLDGMLPHPTEDESAATQFLLAQKDHEALAGYAPRVFQNDAEFVAARIRLGFSEESARMLAPRAIRRVPDGFVLNHDPRLNHASAIKLTPAMCSAFYGAVTAPTLALIAENGLRVRAGLDSALATVTEIAQCTVARVPGSHHTHMEEGAAEIADHIRSFLAA